MNTEANGGPNQELAAGLELLQGLTGHPNKFLIKNRLVSTSWQRLN